MGAGGPRGDRVRVDRRDYFEGGRSDGPTTFARVVDADFGWDVRDVVAWTRALKPATPGKGHYFLDAFFGARLFARPTLDELQRDWHRIFYPLEYGTGIMRFRMPPLMTGFRRVPATVGHSGASGTVLFRSPELGLTVVGTVNQVKHRSMPYQLMVRTTIAARG